MTPLWSRANTVSFPASSVRANAPDGSCSVAARARPRRHRSSNAPSSRYRTSSCSPRSGAEILPLGPLLAIADQLILAEGLVPRVLRKRPADLLLDGSDVRPVV